MTADKYTPGLYEKTVTLKLCTANMQVVQHMIMMPATYNRMFF